MSFSNSHLATREPTHNERDSDEEETRNLWKISWNSDELGGESRKYPESW